MLHDSCAVAAPDAGLCVQYISAMVLVWLLVRQKRLFMHHLRTPPSWPECWPVLQVRQRVHSAEVLA